MRLKKLRNTNVSTKKKRKLRHTVANVRVLTLPVGKYETHMQN